MKRALCQTLRGWGDLARCAPRIPGPGSVAEQQCYKVGSAEYRRRPRVEVGWGGRLQEQVVSEGDSEGGLHQVAGRATGQRGPSDAAGVPASRARRGNADTAGPRLWPPEGGLACEMIFLHHQEENSPRFPPVEGSLSLL